MITQKELKEILEYNENTGKFFWKIKPMYNVNIGDKAGNNHNGYTRLTINGKKYLTHRLAWLYVYGEFPKGDLDHIDNDRGNCRINNLRIANKSTNGFNRKKQANNTSGIKGVIWSKASNKWMVKIGVNKKKLYFGVWNDLEFAELVAQEARAKYHGEYANDS